MKPLYGPMEQKNTERQEAETLGNPGEYPFTRGIYPAMYRGRLWTMRQYAGMGDAEESNRRYKFLLASGTMGLSVAFDLPTQIGYDSDNSMCHGEVGRVGVAIDSIEDMERLFADLPMEEISTSMTINATAVILLALYIAVARRRGFDVKKLSGTLQNDILKEYIARGTYIFPVPHAVHIATDIMSWTTEHMPKWNPISISGYHMREAGSTAVQEVAFTLANGRTYVQAAIDAGLHVDRIGPRISFFFNAHQNFLEEIAKFRAARRLWARIMRQEFHAEDPRSWMLRFHTQTAGSSLAAQQPENNIVRTAIEALAAVLGGTQSLHTNGYDEALALPTEEAAQIALRTQQILAYESGVTQTVDPLGGSYCIEALTDEIEKQAMAYMEKITEMGGTLHAIECGYIQREIQNAAYELQQAIEQGTAVMVGVNRFTQQEETVVPVQRIDESLERRQIDRVQALRLRRLPGRWRAGLQNLEEAARSGTNLMPAVLEAVESDATVGEIADTLRKVFGEYQQAVML